MRLPGYCSECRRVRQVSVGSGWRPGAVPTGICATCEAAARFRPGQIVEEINLHGAPARTGEVTSVAGGNVMVRWEGEGGARTVAPDRLRLHRPTHKGGRQCTS